MDYNAINQWYARATDNGRWAVANDRTGASIFCDGEAVAKAVLWYLDEADEIGLCDEAAIEGAELALAPHHLGSTIWERWDNARDELEHMLAELA